MFGRIGDRFGRVKGMTAAICCYSGVSFVADFARTPEQLLVARFVVCMGVGGMWPNGGGADCAGLAGAIDRAGVAQLAGSTNQTQFPWNSGENENQATGKHR